MSVDSGSLSFPLKVPWQHAEPKAHAQRHTGTLTRTQRGTPVTEMQSASDACASTHADTPTTPPQHQGYTDTHSETHTVRARENTQTDAAWPVRRAHKLTERDACAVGTTPGFPASQSFLFPTWCLFYGHPSAQPTPGCSGTMDSS